jgi:hypothetical protein
MYTNDAISVHPQHHPNMKIVFVATLVLALTLAARAEDQSQTPSQAKFQNGR